MYRQFCNHYRVFHPQKIRQKIEAIERAKKIKLVEHSVEECVKIYDYFKSLEKTEGKKTFYCRAGENPDQFQYSEQEKAWIENEMYVCACSFPYWYFRYFFIKTKEGHIQRPERLIAQLIFLDVLASLDLEGLPILLLILKARQLGISTIVEAIIQWIAEFQKGSHTVVASAEEEKSEEMANMVWLGLEMQPLWMQPRLTRDDKSMGPEFGDIHSDILIQHGSMTKGISRGSTPVAGHLSEVAYYPNPIETIESSLIRAMHENPRTFLALESTARRKDDWFHRTWKKNRKGEDTGYNRFTCVFLPWYVGRDKYPTADWIKNHPIPYGWNPMQETLKQAADARLYVAETRLLREHMPPDWEMPIEQMWFWEFNFVEAQEGGDETLKSFLAELAADERSCFQSKKWSVFTQKTLDELEKNRDKKYFDYAMTGDGIDQKFTLQEFQSKSAQRVDIEYQCVDGKRLYWKLVPLRETPKDENLDFFLRVWEKPKLGYEYTIGIDISSGIGQNRTVYFVNRNGKGSEPDVEVALLCSPWISSPETPPFAHALGAWYGTYMQPVPEAKIAPEIQISTGDFISFQLAQLGYTNFFYTVRMDMRIPPGQRPTRRGFASTSWQKQMMMEAFKHAVETGWMQVNSDELIEECGNLEADETEAGKTLYGHAHDQTDDCYVAGGISYFAAHGKETLVERMSGKVKPRKKTKTENEEVKKETGVVLLGRMFQSEDRKMFHQAGEDGERYEGQGVY